ncbi:MAG: hypothetical protein JXB05_08505 [Myxococcaceae bacterium]|nr:hypothetical protein [Myxococcaceae bacterium]
MDDRGIRRWALLGALASAALLTPACETKELPRARGAGYEGVANDAQDLSSFIDERQEQQPATGGSGRAQGEDPSAVMGVQGFQGGIGAPGYSTPREPAPSDQFYSEPAPGKEEPGGADMPGESRTPGVGSPDDRR